ncbi:MAG TPA: LacI family DNA-binding transcriptional regulator [Acidimicrobiales bacterium]|nr:LacI family DNA-binding transcriptional regulator [Acidimicrobiales bacterium]
MTTLRDIARETGCSTATVSRALNGAAHVDPKTRRRIEAAATALGYRSNVLARALRRHQSGTIGLVIPSLEKYNYAAAVRLLHDALSAEDYQLILCCHRDDPALELRALQSLADRQVDAIVHVPFDDAGAAALLQLAEPLPIVELYRRSRATDVDAVVGDDERGGHDLAEHVLAAGHRRIALVIGGAELSTTKGRVAGFSRAVREAGVSADDCPVFYGTSGLAWGQQVVDELLAAADPPTAIITGSTQIALGAMQQLVRAGAQIPRDVSFVAYSNADWCELMSPPVTTYEIPQPEMGLMAAQLLLNHLRPSIDHDLQPRTVSFSGRLLVRASVGAPRQYRPLRSGVLVG